MTVYSVVLFLHVMANLALVSALSLEAALVSRLRREATASGLLPWMGLMSAIPLISIVSLAVLLLSGGFMADRRAEWILAWPRVALVMLITIGVLGAITGRRLRHIRRTVAAGEGADAALGNARPNTGLVVSLHLRVALVLGAVLLMTTQPGFKASLIVFVASFLCGLLFLVPLARRPG